MLAVLGATLIQGITSFTLTQLLSKDAQRLIAELRRKVQEHIGRLPVAYYDANKSGALVSRIMSDVEGVRNLIGTGLVEFVGGILTAICRSGHAAPHQRHAHRPRAASSSSVFALILRKAFGKIRPIFRERGKINAEVTGRLTESLGGRARRQGLSRRSRARPTSSPRGVQRLLDNVMRSLTAISLMSLSATVLMGMVGAHRDVRRRAADPRQPPTDPRRLHDRLHQLPGLPGRARCSRWSASAPRSPRRSPVSTARRKSSRNAPKTKTRAHRPHRRDHRRRRFRGRHLLVRPRQAGPARRQLRVRSPAPSPRWSGPSGSGKSTIISLIAAFHEPTDGVIRVDGIDLSTVRLDAYRTQLGVVLQDTFLFDGTIRENIAFARPGATEEQILEACRIARVDEFAEQLREEVRHHRRRARRQALRRPAPARLHRPRHPGRPAHPDPRRSHLEPRLRIRSLSSRKASRT